MAPEAPPGLIWGQGTPGAIEPFTTVNRASLYMEVNGTADESCVWMKVAEDGDANDWVRLVSGVSNFVRTNVSGTSVAEVDLRTVLAGTSGTWNSTLFVRIENPATSESTGYISAAEFEVSTKNTSGSPLTYAITLNSILAATTNHAQNAYIGLWDYGTATKLMSNIFGFPGHTAIPATQSASALLSSAATDQAITHTIKFMVQNVPYWILCSNASPAA